tara:strand:- start:1359 stop:2378 length:1020 start_codon:yes stop_codon:yes gene_type:complete
MKILITGGCGFVGTNNAIFLKKKGYEVNTLDNLIRKGSRFNLNLLKKYKIKNFNIDIKNKKKIIKLPKYDLIIDCCAEAAIEVSKKDIDRVIDTNLIGTLNILNKIKKDSSKIIFLSSSRVYSITDLRKNFKNNIKKKVSINKLINESNNTNGPKSIYGFSKLASEMLIEEFSYAFKIKYLINRCGVISGPLQFGKQDQGFISMWVWNHINKKKMKYIGFGGHGHQVRDVLHIDDLCKLIYLQILNFKKINNLIFTVGGSKKSNTSLKELTVLCEKITKNKIKLSKISRTSIYDIPYYLSDNKFVTKKYGWKPKKTVFDIVNDIYIWITEHKKILIKYF